MFMTERVLVFVSFRLNEEIVSFWIAKSIVFRVAFCMIIVYTRRKAVLFMCVALAYSLLPHCPSLHFILCVSFFASWLHSMCLLIVLSTSTPLSISLVYSLRTNVSTYIHAQHPYISSTEKSHQNHTLLEHKLGIPMQ